MFNGIDNNYLLELINIINTWNNLEIEKHTINYIFNSIPDKFVNYMKEINIQIINNQIKSINNSIEIYEKHKSKQQSKQKYIFENYLVYVIFLEIIFFINQETKKLYAIGKDAKSKVIRLKLLYPLF
mgnify:CR=1 FL=1